MLGRRKLKPRDYVSILKRRKWFIVIPVVILPIIFFAISFAVPPRFLSQTLVIIEQQKVPDDYVKPVIQSDLDDRLASMKEQILSRSRIQPIVEQMNLYPSQSMESRIAEARKNITIKPIHSEIAHSGGLPGFFITFEASDPRVAQAVCGEITSLFVNENLRSREQSAQGTTDFLKNQLDDAKRGLDQQDARLALFQQKYIGKLPGEENSNINMLTSLNTQLEAATQALARMQQDKAYADTMIAQQSRDSGSTTFVAPDDPRQADLDKLQDQESDLATRYTPDYPDLISVRRKIADLKTAMAKNGPKKQTSQARSESLSLQQLRAQSHAMQQGIDAKRAEQEQLQRAVRSYQSRIEASPLVSEQYKEITRDYQQAQKFYDDLLAKMNQSKMATDLERRQQGEQFRVMDAPNLPDTPSFPKRPLFAFAGLVVGFAVGFGLVLLLEYKDQAIRNEDDIWETLHVGTLAVVTMADTASPTKHSKTDKKAQLALHAAKG